MYSKPDYGDTDDQYYNTQPTPASLFDSILMGVLFAVGIAAVAWGLGVRLELPYLS